MCLAKPVSTQNPNPAGENAVSPIFHSPSGGIATPRVGARLTGQDGGLTQPREGITRRADLNAYPVDSQNVVDFHQDRAAEAARAVDLDRKGAGWKRDQDGGV